MKITPIELTVGQLSEDYLDSSELGARAYGGKLDIRPAYQREFVYTGKQRQAVIETASKDFPLNVMYWAVNGEDDYEVIDGQQRTISLCQYMDSEFALALFLGLMALGACQTLPSANDRRIPSPQAPRALRGYPPSPV